MGALPEANLQGELYHQCKIHGVEVILEFRSRWGRQDAAILNIGWTHVICFVECKRYRLDEETKQYRKYAASGVPLLPLTFKDDVAAFVLDVKSRYNAGTLPGVKFSDVISPSNHYTNSHAMHPVWHRKNRAKAHLDEDLIVRADRAW